MREDGPATFDVPVENRRDVTDRSNAKAAQRGMVA
jgi:hypothetical protein